MQNIQRSLVDRRSLNGLQVIRLHYNTADDIQKYMTVIRESIKVIEIGLGITTQVFLRAMAAPGTRTFIISFMCPPRHRAM